MYDISKNQNNFSGGELDPLLHTANKLTRYENGMARVLNWVVEPTGGLRTRPSTKHVRNVVENSVLHAGLFDDDSVVMEFFEGSGIAHTENNAYGLGILPYKLADLPALSFTQLNDLFFITDGAHPIGLLKHYSNDNWEFGFATSYDGPYEAENIDDGKTMLISGSAIPAEELDAAQAVWDNLGYKPFKKIWRDNVRLMKITMVGDVLKAGHVGSLFEIIDYDYSDAPPWVADEAVGTADLRRVDDRVYNAVAGGNSGTIVPDWTDAYDYAPETGAVKWHYVHNNIMQGHVLTVDESANTAIVVAYGAYVISLLAVATHHWRIGSWNTKNGYPKFSEFHQQRFVPAATKASPRGMWPSKIDDYLNHEVNGMADGAMAFSNPASYGNGMRWIESNGDLVFGGAAGETIVQRGNNGAGFVFENISVEMVGRVGSAAIAPVVMPNREMLLVHKSLKKLIATGVGDGVKDLSIMSGHLLKAGIKKTILQSDPFTVIYCLLNDGRVAVLTYEFDQEVVAWADWDFGGVVDDICIIPRADGEQVFLKIKRGNGWCLELLDWHFEPKHDTSSDLVPMLDGRIEITVAQATKSFGGLGIYEGLAVDVYTAGRKYENIVVVGGAIVLPHAAVKITVGFAYENLLRLLPAQFGLQDGGSDGRLRQCKAVTLNMDACFGGLVGEPADDGQSKDADHWESLDYGYSDAGRKYTNHIMTVPITGDADAVDMIDIYQNLYLPMRIKGITRQIELFKAQNDGGTHV